jgi:hypothetical protein
MKTIISYLCFALFIFFTGCAKPTPHTSNTVEFLAIGDTPYNIKEQMQLHESLLTQMDSSPYDFVVVYGDILSGQESCTDALVLQRLGMFHMIKENRVFYTPGDNEWTDCDRKGKTFRYSELERLNFLRKFIQLNPTIPPTSWQYKRQKELIENAMWQYKNVQFATVHMVSTQNGRIEILKDKVSKALQEVDKRDKANIKWLKEVFKNAKKNNAKSVIIVSQADVTRSKHEAECTSKNPQTCNPFKKFKEILRQEARTFKKPVLFLHGDTNPYCFDKQFGKNIAPNLWRLNAWGDYQSHADATVVSYDSSDINSPFKAHTLQSGQRPQQRCKN